MNDLKKVPWQERVKALQKYQVENEFSLRELSEELEVSLGKLSYELTLAEALDKFPELSKIKTVTEAILFIKRKNFHREFND